MTCAHETFAAAVTVGRLSDTDGGPVTGYMADIKIRCAQCDEPFCFLGLLPGYDSKGAAVSVDGREARIALTPSSQDSDSFLALTRGPVH